MEQRITWYPSMLRNQFFKHSVDADLPLVILMSVCHVVSMDFLHLKTFWYTFVESLMWSDPMLAITCFFGPCTPYQYRLNGPGKWDGARKAIMTQWGRTLDSLKTRPLGFKEQKSQKNFFIFCFILVATFCVLLQVIFMR